MSEPVGLVRKMWKPSFVLGSGSPLDVQAVGREVDAMTKFSTPSEIATSNPAGEPTIRPIETRRRNLVRALIAVVCRAVRLSKQPKTYS